METNVSNTTISDMKGSVSEFSVSSVSPDSPNSLGETYWDNDYFETYYGYYRNIPELKAALDSLATWVIGKGIDTSDAIATRLSAISGVGVDSFKTIIRNQFLISLINGDSYAEIIRNDKGILINLKPISPSNMRVVFNDKAMIIRYEERNSSKNTINTFKPEDIFHLSNDRLADETHGLSVVEACKWVIDARNEAMADWRRIAHRSTIRVMYIDVDDTAKLNHIKTEYASAINSKELMLIPAKKGEAEFEDLTLPPHQAFLEWIRYLENFFYQAVRVPRVIATSENFTEASSKVGYLSFEPVYTEKQVWLEEHIKAQLYLEISFKRPPSLMDNMKTDEQKNTGQLGYQANDVTAGSGA